MFRENIMVSCRRHELFFLPIPMLLCLNNSDGVQDIQESEREDPSLARFSPWELVIVGVVEQSPIKLPATNTTSAALDDTTSYPGLV